MIDVSIFVIVGSLLAILCYFVNIQLMEELKRFSLFFRVAGTIYFISKFVVYGILYQFLLQIRGRLGVVQMF
ncbi:hypothetical protein VN96_1291 [Lactococcus cremoris]|nr:hypothetical protein VN96_1291 [Lactococcus cremoris]